MALGSWSQTAAIKSSSTGNASLKLRAHILVVGHKKFLCVAPASALQPLLVEENLSVEWGIVFSADGAN